MTSVLRIVKMNRPVLSRRPRTGSNSLNSKRPIRIVFWTNRTGNGVARVAQSQSTPTDAGARHLQRKWAPTPTGARGRHRRPMHTITVRAREAVLRLILRRGLGSPKELSPHWHVLFAREWVPSSHGLRWKGSIRTVVTRFRSSVYGYTMANVGIAFSYSCRTLASPMSAACAERERTRRGLEDAVEILTGGTDPADEVHPEVVEAMGELDMDLSDRVPQAVSNDELDGCTVVATMGCSTLELDADVAVRDWALEDAHGQPIDGPRSVIDREACRRPVRRIHGRSIG